MAGKSGPRGRGAPSHKRTAPVQSPDRRPPPKRIAAPSNAEEEKRNMTLIAEEVKATVRTIVNDAGKTNQHFWQATALPRDIPKVLAKIEGLFRATFAPGERYPIYVKYGTAGSDTLISSIKTYGHNFRNDMNTLVEQTKRDPPNRPMTVIVLIYSTKQSHQDNWEQQALVKALRDDLASKDLQATNDLVDAQSREISRLAERLHAKTDEIDYWRERAVTSERRMKELRDMLQEKDRQIARGGVASAELGRLKQEIRKQGETIRKREDTILKHEDTIRKHEDTIQQRNTTIRDHEDTFQKRNNTIREHEDTIRKERETIQMHEDTIQQRDKAIKKRDDDIEELQEKLGKSNLKQEWFKNNGEALEEIISDLKDEMKTILYRQQMRTKEVDGLKQEVTNLQATVQARDETIANAMERERRAYDTS